MNPAEKIKLHREKILEIGMKYGVSNIRVFGSVARGEDKETSDADFLVTLPEKFTLLDHVGLQEELQEILGCHVDLASDRIKNAEAFSEARSI